MSLILNCAWLFHVQNWNWLWWVMTHSCLEFLTVCIIILLSSLLDWSCDRVRKNILYSSWRTSRQSHDSNCSLQSSSSFSFWIHFTDSWSCCWCLLHQTASAQEKSIQVHSLHSNWVSLDFVSSTSLAVIIT